MCKCLCWSFTGAIALADAADTESARTTIANFRIIAVIPLLRAPRPQLTQALSHTGSLRIVEPGASRRTTCLRYKTLWLGYRSPSLLESWSFGHQCGPTPQAPLSFVARSGSGFLRAAGALMKAIRVRALSGRQAHAGSKAPPAPRVRHRSPASCPGRGPAHAPGLAGCRLGNAGLESALPSGAVSGRRSYN